MSVYTSSHSGGILRLGRYVLAIVVEWLPGDGFVDLDTALCNKKDRKAYMSWFRESHRSVQELLFKSDKPIPLYYEVYDWAFERGLDVDALKSMDITARSLICGLGDDFFKPYLRNLLCLKFDKCSVFGAVFLPDILTHCRELRELSITNSLQNIEKAVTIVAETCKNLTSCDFSCCINLLDASFVRLCRQCLFLEKINIYFCTKLSSASIIATTVHCRRLKCFHVDGSLRMSLRDAAIFAVHSRSHTLTEFSRHLSTTRSVHCFLAYQGGSLKHLNISHMSNKIDDETVALIGLYCPLLSHLNISGFKYVTEAGITPIVTALPGLEHLSISQLDVGLSTLSLIVDHCSGLRSLRLDNHGMPPEAVVSCIIGSNVRNTLNKLVVVSSNLSDDDLFMLCSGCPVLKELEMLSIPTITDVGVINSAPHMKHMEKLTLSSRKLTDKALFAIAAHCYSITDLNLSETREATDAGVMAVVQECRAMLHLNIRTAKLVTDLIISALCDLNRVRLVSLNIFWCKFITLEALCQLIQTASRLRSVWTRLRLPASYYVDYPDLVVEEDVD